MPTAEILTSPALKKETMQPNYSGNRRRKEEARKKKQEEKRNKRLHATNKESTPVPLDPQTPIV